MRFSQSTHVNLFVFKDFNAHHKDIKVLKVELIDPVELIDLVNSYNFFYLKRLYSDS